MSRLNCYHGSPGLPSDFAMFQGMLGDVEVFGIARDSWASDGFFLGYSWGANLAIRDASESGKCQGLIFISPYLKSSKKREASYFVLLRAMLAVGLLRKKTVGGFLKKTASPCAVPESYQALSGALGERLFDAVREKNDWELNSQDMLISLAKIPTLIISGEQDSVDGTIEGIAAVRRQIPSAQIVSIPGAGHAVLWTHTKQVTEAISKFIAKHGGF